MPKYMLRTPVSKLLLALFGINCLIIMIFFYLPFYFFFESAWNTQLFRILGFILLVGIISILDIGFVVRHFISVTPSASFAYHYDDGPRLHYSGDPKTSITITWHTSKKDRTQILFGTDPKNLDQYIGDVVKLHRKSFERLSPDTTYYYKIQNSDTLFHFKTAPEQNIPVKFAVIGDTQNGGGLGDPEWAFPQIADAISKEKALKLLFHVGDLCDQGNDLRSWHAFFKAAENILPFIPMHVAIGNHDSGTQYLQDPDAKKYPDEGANFDYFFGYPYSAPADENQTTSFRGRYYSFDYGNCHFLIVDSQNSKMAYEENPQWDFIRQDLSNCPESMWKFVLIHRDLVRIDPNLNTYKYDKFAKFVCPLLHEYGVDAIFQGHSHNLQYLEWQYNKDKEIFIDDISISKQKVTYITCAGAGNESRKNPALEGMIEKDEQFYIENSSHYLTVETDEKSCKISAKYPDSECFWSIFLEKR